ncbi:hypothetical protein D5F51_03270 [Yersinia hibernica]|uniref:Uncharacterized protein n=1 Tax=Yersinia hibernica TaxID=2339259 RepID=A0ABX5QWV8_9GAMM|nr:hypothetical protein D5F51_03270 [Yersinia hibernica]
MGKVSYLKDLTEAYMAERVSKWEKCNSPYKNKPLNRWVVVMNAHNRKVIRKHRRSTGKSNRLRSRRTALGMVRSLNYLNAMSEICRRNRQAPPYRHYLAEGVV